MGWLDADKMVQAIGSEYLDDVAAKVVKAGSDAAAPQLYSALPDATRRWLQSIARRKASDVVSGMLKDLQV